MLDKDRWVAMWQNLGGDTGDYCLSVLRLVANAYGEVQRRYHTAEHVEFCLRQFDEVRGDVSMPAEVEAALWLHDVVYDPRGIENEEKSARWAVDVLSGGGIGAETVALISRLILETRHKDLSDDENARTVVDVDLSILGSSETKYDIYEKLIREEYAFVPVELFREKRIEVLSFFLNQPSIYQTRFFRERYEAQARRNLERAIRSLKECHEAQKSE